MCLYRTGQKRKGQDKERTGIKTRTRTGQDRTGQDGTGQDRTGQSRVLSWVQWLTAIIPALWEAEVGRIA